MAKDLFSDRSDLYALYRPVYPSTLFEYILQFVEERKTAWDCATGNGQAAGILSGFFERVEATDISAGQLSKAIKKDNIHYHIAPAEQTAFPENHFDLITVATAYHWLNWKKFKKEVERVAKPGAIIAIWSYNLLLAPDAEMNAIIYKFYHDIIGEYWDPERRYVDESYSSIEFDYKELPPANWKMDLYWTKEHFLGYLESWSAVQTYIRKNNVNPIQYIDADVSQVWGNEANRKFTFPLFLRIGKIMK